MSEFELNVVDTPANAVYPKAQGGTELLYHELKGRIDPTLLNKFNIIQSRVRSEFFDDRPTILWLHDLPEDPESAHLRDPISRSRFAQIVFVSHWQQLQYNLKLGIPLEDGIVIKNAIEPFVKTSEKSKDGPFKIIYHSTPHRGLGILAAAVKGLAKYRNDFVVDVFSSFELYGWKERDKEFQRLFDELNEIDCVNMHGTVPYAEIRKQLYESHILAYPSIYPETSCRVAMESMAAGLLAVVPNFGALPETCTDFALMYNWHSDPLKHAQIFAANLDMAMNSYWSGMQQALLNMQQNYYNYFYGWDLRAEQWTSLLRSL